ncbi:hypothetical protein MAR_007669, partial [Mya arenaria]
SQSTEPHGNTIFKFFVLNCNNGYILQIRGVSKDFDMANGIGLEAGIGVKRCEFISSTVSISLPFPDDIDAKVWWVAAFCMSMDAFIPHIMIVFTIVVFLCVCFTLAHCPDEN